MFHVELSTRRVNGSRLAVPRGTSRRQNSGRLAGTPSRRGKSAGQAVAWSGPGRRGSRPTARQARGPASARPAAGQRSARAVGGSLTMSRPPTASSGAAHSAVAAGRTEAPRRRTASAVPRWGPRPTTSARPSTTRARRARAPPPPPRGTGSAWPWRRGGPGAGRAGPRATTRPGHAAAAAEVDDRARATPSSAAEERRRCARCGPSTGPGPEEPQRPGPLELRRGAGSCSEPSRRPHGSPAAPAGTSASGRMTTRRR